MISVWRPASGAAPRMDLQRFVELNCLMGSDHFSSSLLDCLDPWITSQHFSVLRLGDEQPSMLMAGTRYHDPRVVWRCWRAYARKFHSHDQLATSRQQNGRTALIGHTLAEDIEFEPYRNEVYQKNGMSERLSSLSWDQGGNLVLFNLYRHRETGYFADDEIEAFEQLAPALLQLLRGHLALRGKGQSADDWRPILLRKAPLLTLQELEVCVLLLRGLTHAGVAADLGIKESSVKTYKNRAFDRLGINFRNQLFALVQASSVI